jgi:hypothetical protein
MLVENRQIGRQRTAQNEPSGCDDFGQGGHLLGLNRQDAKDAKRIRSSLARPSFFVIPAKAGIHA